MMNSSNSDRPGGFSLIEMMVVLGLVGLLMAFAAPNLFSLISSTSLSGEGTLLRNQLTLAQQTAVSKSADVEIRFFYTDDTSNASNLSLYRAYQLFQYNRDGEMEPVSGFFRIRAPVAIHENLSTLLEDSTAQGNDRKFGFVAPHRGRYPAPVGFGGSEVDTAYMAFRFRPDGSTDLPFRTSEGDTWYITLVQGEGALQDNKPPNFLCLQVNPYNGQISEFRPN